MQGKAAIIRGDDFAGVADPRDVDFLGEHWGGALEPGFSRASVQGLEIAGLLLSAGPDLTGYAP